VAVALAMNMSRYSMDDCSCGGGQAGLWSYEQWPAANTGAGCIGGCDGTPFQYHQYQTTVKTMSVWTGGDHNGFTAIYVQFFDGTSNTAGSIPARGADGSITFAAGEMITGTVELCGNGVGTRAGYLHFKTTAGQELKVGDEHTPYYFDAGTSFLTGILGQASNEIDHLALTFMKSVKAAQLQNLNYPTLSAYTAGLTPQVYSTTLCNDGSGSQTQTATFQKSVGSKHSWSVTVAFKVSNSITVSGGVPEIGKVSDTFTWEVSASTTYSQEEDTTSTQTQNYPVTVPARTRINAQFSWWDSECDVPYTADLLYTLLMARNSLSVLVIPLKVLTLQALTALITRLN